MKSKNLILVGALMLGGAAPYVITSCITPATKAEISETKTELSQAKKDAAADPESEILKKKIADLEAKLVGLDVKATAERAESRKEILTESSVAIEGLSPLANLAFPGGGLVLAGLAAFLRKFA